MSEGRGIGRVGLWGAVVTGVAALAYAVTIGAVGAIATDAITWTGLDEFLAGYSTMPTTIVLLPPLVASFAFLAVMVGVVRATDATRHDLAMLGLCLAVVYTAVLGCAYWVQVTYVAQSITEGLTDGLAPWIVWYPRSFFWALESFGYFAMCGAAFLAAVALRGTPASKVARGALGLLGPLGIVFLVNEWIGLSSPPMLSPMIAMAWSIVTGVACLALAWSMRRAVAAG